MENISATSWLEIDPVPPVFTTARNDENVSFVDLKPMAIYPTIIEDRNIAQPVEFNESEHQLLNELNSYHDLSTSNACVNLDENGKSRGCEFSALSLVYSKSDYDDIQKSNDSVVFNLHDSIGTYDERTGFSGLPSEDDKTATGSSISLYEDSVEETISSVVRKNYDSEGIETPKETVSDDEINTLRRYTCNTCSEDFTTLSVLDQHIAVNHQNRNNKCTLCDKTFSRVDYLTLHMRHHTGEKPHVCSVCNKGFTQSGSLNKHMHLHSGQRPFECNVCGHRFTENVKLKNHMRRHNGDRPFRCEICDKTFAEATNLKRHFRTHTGK